MERIKFGRTGRDKKRTSWIREQTKVEEILRHNKKKITWAGNIMRRRDKRWTVRVTEGPPCKRW